MREYGVDEALVNAARDEANRAYERLVKAEDHYMELQKQSRCFHEWNYLGLSTGCFPFPVTEWVCEKCGRTEHGIGEGI